MHPNGDFRLRQPAPPHEQDLLADLELGTLLRAMSGDDAFLFEVARKTLLAGLDTEVETILYRQEIVHDCLKNPHQVRSLYDATVEAIEGKRKHYISVFRSYPSGTLYDAIGALEFYAGMLKRVRGFADAHAERFESRGFRRLFAMLAREFSDEYFATIQDHLRELKFRDGVLISAELGHGNEAASIVLRRPLGPRLTWLQRFMNSILRRRPPGFSFRLAERDEAGARILSDLRNRGISLVANALAQSTDHIVSFFDMLRTELGFYVGCLNLRDHLAARRASITFPRPRPAGSGHLRFTDLRDASLVLTLPGEVVPNSVDMGGKRLVVITGANQGGKSSFLRALGLAQAMMQCGMFVAAESFEAEICRGLFTHYKREEDATMKSGKLDEELARMSAIVSAISPGALLLFSESFASTNAREGSEIAGQIVRALVERGVKVLFVTHLYEFAREMFDLHRDDALFLRAARQADGRRTFKLAEGEPLETSYGEDLFNEVFRDAALEPASTRPRSLTR